MSEVTEEVTQKGTVWLVRAADRTSAGHPGIWTRDRFWTSATDTEVIVLDELKCPTIPNQHIAGRTLLHPTIIGQEEWAGIRANPQLTCRRKDEASGADDNVALVRRIAELEAELDHAHETIKGLADQLSVSTAKAKANEDLLEQATKPKRR
jgi:hypothetical protein